MAVATRAICKAQMVSYVTFWDLKPSPFIALAVGMDGHRQSRGLVRRLVQDHMQVLTGAVKCGLALQQPPPGVYNTPGVNSDARG